MRAIVKGSGTFTRVFALISAVGPPTDVEDSASACATCGWSVHCSGQCTEVTYAASFEILASRFGAPHRESRERQANPVREHARFRGISLPDGNGEGPCHDPNCCVLFDAEPLAFCPLAISRGSSRR